MSEDKIINIIFAGVGGQGILLASDTVCDIALLEGYDTKKSEVHGMAQRGGSVVSQVRFGKKIFSPLIPLEEADFIVSFEKLEALRYLEFLKPDGIVILNDHKIVPQTVQMGEVKYPKEIETLCATKAKLVISKRLTELAAKLGNIRILNVIMLGILSNFLPFKEKSWIEALTNRVPKKFLQLNLDGFQEGRKISEQSSQEKN
jgi:indolepyruvate ferredoxin oxidoreductase beta subunit